MACALRLKSRIVGTVWLMSPWVHLTLAKRMKWIRHVPTTLLKSQSTASLLYKTLSVAAKEPPCKSDPNILNYDREKLVKAMLQDNMAESLEGANNDLMVCLELYHSFGFSYKDVTLPVHVFWGTKVTNRGHPYHNLEKWRQLRLRSIYTRDSGSGLSRTICRVTNTPLLTPSRIGCCHLTGSRGLDGAETSSVYTQCYRRGHAWTALAG